MLKADRPRSKRVVARSVIAGLSAGAFTWILVTTAGLVLMSPSANAVEPSDSAVTVTAAGFDANAAESPFPDLAVTVSQTVDLQAQAIEVSWTGASRSTRPGDQSGGRNFLQIMQCWGDDPLNADRPDRRTCQYGGLATQGATRDAARTSMDVVADDDLQYTVQGSGFTPTITAIPFLARDGSVVTAIEQVNGVNKLKPNVDLNQNQFFTKLTTNEVSWAGSGAAGDGSAKFELQTAAQSPGLGCGAPVEVDGATAGQSCWLVIIPRGTADNGSPFINQSGLFADSWEHALAVRLEFRPLGLRCTLGAKERQLNGSELVAGAVASWQPALCSGTAGSVFSIITGTESDALTAANGTTPAPLALASKPLNNGTTDTLSYAPIALTGITIAIAVDKFPSQAGNTPQEFLDNSNLPWDELNLTPRLLAKLLTNSYLLALPPGDKSHVGYEDAEHPGHNPQFLTEDPDFLEVNAQEWAYQSVPQGNGLADVLLPQGRSDAARAVWAYVLSDPDAVAFLAGQPDPWGMVVNPWFSTNPSVNPTGTGLALPIDNFPKADPIEIPASDAGGAVNLVTWRPYTNDLDQAAYLTLRGDAQILGSWDPNAATPKYNKTDRSLPGFQKVLGLTDTASAARYAVVTASLLNPAGNFVAPTTASLLAAAAAMTPTTIQPQVLGFDPASSAAAAAANAYPLAMPVYAAVSPRMSDAALRQAYAAFIDYAIGDGQVEGTAPGKLPPGYAPIPESWHSAAINAAAAIRAGYVPPRPAGTNQGSSGGFFSNNSGGSGSTVDTAPNPQPSGTAAGPLSGGTTPSDSPEGAIAAAVPLSAGAAALAALAVPIISRMRRPI